MCAQTRAVLAGDARTTFLSDKKKKKKKKVGETNFQSLSLSLSLGAFSLTLSRVALSLVAVSRLRLYESCCAFYGIARGNAALLYISSLCWCVVGGKKQRKIS